MDNPRLRCPRRGIPRHSGPDQCRRNSCQCDGCHHTAERSTKQRQLTTPWPISISKNTGMYLILTESAGNWLSRELSDKPAAGWHKSLSDGLKYGTLRPDRGGAGCAKAGRTEAGRFDADGGNWRSSARGGPCAVAAAVRAGARRHRRGLVARHAGRTRPPAGKTRRQF